MPLRAEGRAAVTRRFFQPEDEAAVVDLLGRVFGTWPAAEVSVSPAEHLRWKMASRDDALRLQLVGDVDGRIVASRLFVMQDVKLAERLVSARQEVDAAVDADYQGKGVMTAMTYPEPERFADYDLYLCVRGGHPAFRRMRKFETRGRFPTSVEVLEQPAPTTTTAAARAGWTCREVAQFDERIDAFWRAASGPFDFIIARTKDYMNWRYADRRSGGFTIEIAEEGDRLVGYTVFRRSRGRGYIADLLALPGRTDVARSLVSDALGELTRAGVSAVECWTRANHPYYELLHECGFIKRRRRLELLVMPVRASEAELEFLRDENAAVHLMAGDTDLV